MTLFPWTATVDGEQHSGRWPGVSAAEVADMVATEARLLFGTEAAIHVRIHVRTAVPVSAQVEDTGDVRAGTQRPGGLLDPRECAMGLLSAGDEKYHYVDESHRWVAPASMSQDVWDAGIRAHMDAHRATMGGGGMTRRR